MFGSMSGQHVSNVTNSFNGWQVSVGETFEAFGKEARRGMNANYMPCVVKQ